MILEHGECTILEGEEETTVLVHLDLPGVLKAMVVELSIMAARSNTDYHLIKDAFSGEGYMFREREEGEW